MLPKRLVFCGGGTRCLVFLQGIVDLDKKGIFKNVNEYWGTSAGAMIASLFAMTKSPQEVKKIMFSANYLKFRDIDISNILGIQNSWGLDDGKSLVQEIENIFETIGSGNKNKTMSDMPELNIVVSDISIRETIVCNSQTFPNLRVVEALRASMSLPFFFKPYRAESGHLWVDGAIKANFPWHCLPDDKARSEALGFTFDKQSVFRTPTTLMEYVFSMIHFDEPKKIISLKKTWPNIIWFPIPPFPSWFIRMQPEDFRLVEQLGKEGVERWSNSLTDRSCGENQEFLPLSASHQIPQSFSHQGHKDELSENHLSDLCLSAPADFPKHLHPSPLSSQTRTNSPQHSYRRWSV